MSKPFKNFLYDNPQYYELVYPEPDGATARMCRRMFERFLPSSPRSILDVGCGTARDLERLSDRCEDCWGVDRMAGVIEYARMRRPKLHLAVGDMRTVRLGRTFDAIVCMGSTLMYAITNEDVTKVMETFAIHAHDGTLLILDIRNACGLLGGGSFKETTETRVSTAELSAEAVSHHRFDHRHQLMIRERTWTMGDGQSVQDYCEYRLLFPPRPLAPRGSIRKDLAGISRAGCSSLPSGGRVPCTPDIPAGPSGGADVAEWPCHWGRGLPMCRSLPTLTLLGCRATQTRPILCFLLSLFFGPLCFGGFQHL